jgi:ribosomal protein S27AE
MDDEILCPRCGADDELTGHPNGDVIRLTCRRCAVSWDRDPSPSCPTCASRDVVPVPQAVWDKARGTQLTVSFFRVVNLCSSCDAEVLARQQRTSSPLPPDENPAATGR